MTVFCNLFSHIGCISLCFFFFLKLSWRGSQTDRNITGRNEEFLGHGGGRSDSAVESRAKSPGNLTSGAEGGDGTFVDSQTDTQTNIHRLTCCATTYNNHVRVEGVKPHHIFIFSLSDIQRQNIVAGIYPHKASSLPTNINLIVIFCLLHLLTL